SVFERFAETGSARRVWLWFRSEGVKFPLRMHEHAEIRWVEASYHAIHHVLTNPVYAGAATLKQWRLGVERANYEASRAERRYRAVDPDNRLVARGLEREWEESLSALEAATAELARREAERPRVLSESERASLLAVGADLNAVWHAPTTSPRDRKELLRT